MHADLVLEPGHDFRGKQFQRVEYLLVFDTTIIDEEDQVFHPCMAQLCNAFPNVLRRPEEDHLLPHGLVVGVDTPGKPAPVLFEIVRQEFYPMVRWGTDLLPRPFEPHKGSLGIAAGLLPARGGIHGTGGCNPVWAIGEPGLLHGAAEILHLGGNLLKTLPLANQQVPVVMGNPVYAGLTTSGYP